LLPAKEFWKKYDAGEFGKPMAATNETPFDKWVNDVAAMPAGMQVDAVVKKLKELNPGYDGNESHKIEQDVVTQFAFFTDSVTDISPVRALSELKELECRGSFKGRHWGMLSDLSPLQGMHLTSLRCDTNPVADLSPLRGQPLVHLNFQSSAVAELSPLKGMPVLELTCSHTKVVDLSPLKGMKLTKLTCDHTKIADLSDLTGMPLTLLFCNDTPVSDLSPLHGMSLTALSFTPKNITKGVDIIRSMKTLKTMGLSWDAQNQILPAEFWKKYDVGDFKQ
jgi:hypothetical protein